MRAVSPWETILMAVTAFASGVSVGLMLAAWMR